MVLETGQVAALTALQEELTRSAPVGGKSPNDLAVTEERRWAAFQKTAPRGGWRWKYPAQFPVQLCGFNSRLYLGSQ